MAEDEAPPRHEGATLPHECDFLVIGSGAAAMCAALTARVHGLDVLVVEKEERFGGASARSGGCPWIPGNHHAAALGYQDSRAEAEAYLRHEAGPRFDEEVVAAFLDHGPEMVRFLEAHSPVRFGFLGPVPDYHCESPGGSMTGRALYPKNWDAAELGEELHRLRPPLHSGTFLGMQVGVNELRYYATAGRKLGSALYVLKCILLRIRDQMRAGRTMRLALGNALIGGLAAGYFGRGGALWTRAPARRLLRDAGRVAGAVVETDDGLVEVRASRGVMIATGGFPHDSALRAELFPHGARSPETWNLLPFGNSGDGIRMAREAGARFEPDVKSPLALAPAIRLANAEGALETMPGFFNRGKPGVIAVTRDGRRFCDEARSYHDFTVDLLKVTPPGEEPVAWLIFDHRALRRFGMGPAAPWPLPYRRHVRSGLLKRGTNVRDLARAAGIDPDRLEATVARYNRHARDGEDPDFHRGGNAFDIANGDPEHGPNPCVGPLDRAPYYAIRMFAASVGTFAGLRANGKGEALDEAGVPIPGLYVGGNDMLSLTGGDYVSGGCTIGPGLTFGYIAGNQVSSGRQRHGDA